MPTALVYSRLLLGGVLVLLSYWRVGYFPALAVGLITAGLLTDMFDGILARHLGVSTPKLRRLDSTVDQVFWAAVLAASWLAAPAFFARHAAPLLVLLGLEAVSFLKFRREIATHSWGAKAWVLVSSAALLQLLTTGGAGALFWVSFGLDVLSRLEIVGILLVLRQWTSDVPTLYCAGRLRRAQPIKRYKLLNG